MLLSTAGHSWYNAGRASISLSRVHLVLTSRHSSTTHPAAQEPFLSSLKARPLDLIDFSLGPPRPSHTLPVGLRPSTSIRLKNTLLLAEEKALLRFPPPHDLACLPLSQRHPSWHYTPNPSLYVVSYK